MTTAPARVDLVANASVAKATSGHYVPCLHQRRLARAGSNVVEPTTGELRTAAKLAGYATAPQDALPFDDGPEQPVEQDTFNDDQWDADYHPVLY